MEKKIGRTRRGLTDKQKMFVHHYLANGYNGNQAAISSGYKENSARQMANENLTKPDIVQYKSKLMSELANKLGATQEYVIKNLMKCGDLDPEKNGSTVIKATELIGKHHGMFVEKVEIKDKSHEDWLDDIKNE